jgi:hypothetical protein
MDAEHSGKTSVFSFPVFEPEPADIYSDFRFRDVFSVCFFRFPEVW